MKDRITVVNEKIYYSKDNQRLYWLNTIVCDIKDNTLVYTIVQENRSAIVFLEKEYKFNHRNTGMKRMKKVVKYISDSHPMIR
mgnify:CR=1 FL=1